METIFSNAFMENVPRIIFYKKNEIKKKIENLSKKLFSKEKAIHGGCIFTLIAGAIASIAASASAAAGTVAAIAGAVTSAVAGSSIASAAAVGVVTGAATIAGEEIVKAAIK